MHGRRKELRSLVAAAAVAAKNGRLTSCLVLGVTGAGKTTLIQATLAQLAGSVPTVVCRADELDQGVPFSLFTEISHRLRRSTGVLRASADELDEIFNRPREASQLSDYVFDVSRWLRNLFEPDGLGRLVLICEDTHNVDSESLRLLAALIRTTPDIPLAVILTSRLGYEDRIGHLRGLLERMARRGSGLVLELGPLDEDSVRAIAEEVMEESVSPAVLDQIIEHSSGNPFLVTQCLPVMLQSSPPAGSATQLELNRSRLAPKGSSARLVLTRFFPNDDERLVVAQLISIFRGGVSLSNPALPPLIEEFGLDRESVGMAWDALVLAGTLRPESDDSDRYTFIHPIVGEALYESIGPGRRAHLHRLIARQLNSADIGDRRVFDVATHYLLACGGEPDVEAADACLRAADVTENSASAVAALWLKRALDLMPARNQLRATTVFRLVNAYLAVGAAAEAEEASATAEREFAGQPEAAWIALPAALSYLTTGRPERSMDLFDLLKLDDLNPSLAFWVASFQPVVLLNREDPEGASAAYAEIAAYEAAAPADSSVATGLAHATLAAYCALAGRPDDYERHFRGCLDVLPEAPPPYRREMTATLAYLDLLGPGRLGLITDALNASYDRPLDDRELGLLGSNSATAWTMIHWWRGDLALSSKVARLTVFEMQKSGAKLTLASIQAAEVILDIELGRMGSARRAAELMEQGSPGNHGYVALARARLLMAEGRLPEARDLLAHFLSEAQRMGVSAGTAVVAEELVRSLIDAGLDAQAREAADQAYAAAEALDWPLHQMFGLRARGLAYRQPADVLAALEICRDLGLGHEEFVCEVSLARLDDNPQRRLDRALAGFRNEGAVRSELLTQAEYRRLALAPPRRARRKTESSTNLTPTEQQVAALVVQGMRNRTVAETLFISVKTVELHLTHIYLKEGVSGRVELTAKTLQSIQGAESTLIS